MGEVVLYKRVLRWSKRRRRECGVMILEVVDIVVVVAVKKRRDAISSAGCM